MMERTQRQPMISVIIPVYRTEAYLARCVSSVQAQDYANLEIILIDDGSPDGAGAMCDAFAAADARVRVLHKANGGLSSARNAGLDIARGRYVAFVDSDDYVERDYLSCLYGLLADTGAEIAVCGFYDDRSGRITPWRAPDGRVQTLSAVSAVENMLYTRDFDASACAKLFPIRVFSQLRFPEGRLYEEVATTYRLLLLVQRVAVSRTPKYYYVKHPASIVSSRFSERSMDMLTACREIYAYAEGENPILLPAATRKLVYGCFYLLKTMGGDYRAHPEITQELIALIDAHKRTVLRDPCAPRRDKAAIACLAAGPGFFMRVWNGYCRLTGRDAYG